jgi:Zn-dependent protease
MPTRNGALRIFRLFGIDVYLHWYWLLFPFFGKWIFPSLFQGPATWPILIFVSLFIIVLTHEFGHALACRQVGGKADYIILWPLGGVAYASPPQRPGATLWTIAAGPLVNVALVVVLSAFWLCAHNLGWPSKHPDWNEFLVDIWKMNLGLLIFNMLPVFPLDGGQILRSLLWYPFGRSNSLLIASITGFFGVAAAALFILLMYLGGERASAIWLGIIDIFVAMNCWRGIQQALALLRLEKAQRRTEFHCPVCKESPPVGTFWRCGRCSQAFDTFETQSFCPKCNAEYSVTACPYCFNSRPMPEWRGFPTPPPVPPQS